jgi:hypothetical protein
MALTKISGEVIQSGINIGIVTATQVNVGSAVTIHSAGFSVGGSDLHSTGLNLGSGNIISHNINSTGIISATSFSGNVTGNINGNVNSTGVSTFSTLRVGTAVTISSGIISATSFYGDGTNLTNTGSTLSAASGSQRVVLTGQTSGTMTASATSSNLTFNASSGALSATSFSGSGANLTGIAATTNVRTDSLVVSGVSTFNNYVGINTTSASTFLHISGVDIASRGQLSISGASAGARASFYQNSTFIGHISGDTTNGIIVSTEPTRPIVFSSGNVDALKITPYSGPYSNKIGLFGSGTDNVVGAGMSAYLSLDVGNQTSEPVTGLRVTRSYTQHPGKSTNLYAIQGCLNGSGTSGTNKRDMGGVYGYTAVENTGGVIGQVQGSVYSNGIAVLADAEQSNTDGYGSTNGFWADIRKGGGSATNGGLRGMVLNFVSNYANHEGILFNTAYTGSNTISIGRWVRNNVQVGSITCTTSSTTYGTSSDYRLKENVVLLTNAIGRLKQIPVHRFNFISEPNKTVDGFIAHEVSSFVPEAVTGEKDGMQKVPVIDENNQPVLNEDGTQVLKDEPVYQGIDQSKLVPLLTAALQEALTEIETLKARLDAAGL